MKHATDTRKPYSGLSRSLVIAIDVGTTFSGVSYAILEPGEIPKIHGVTRFPGQEHVAGNSKIPSLVYYDNHGRLMAAGAEAENSTTVAQAEDEEWIKAELFKLRLRPRTMQLNMNGMRLSPLPKRKTPVHVFGDYLNYLYNCTRSFISETHANGRALWNSVEPDIQFVLSHPNGWEGPQQTRMRNAAVYGRLVPDTDEGRARIRFVTEGEASLHACVLNGLAADVLSNPSKHGFLIADAGGGTLDISAYAIRGTSPLAMEEIAPPDCIFAGSIFVSRRAREFLEEKLKHSKYGTPDSLDHITRKFDETTKRLFRDRNDLQFIPFGSPLDKDPTVGIRSGQLRLTGNEVANLFEPSVDAAFNAIKAQIDASNGMIRSVFLVGGYAASPWLFSQLQERLRPFRITVSRPDTQTSKAVADGAIGFYCDHHVAARMSKFMYGVEFLRELNPEDPEHLKRKEKLCELPSGPKLLPDAFDCILARGVKVKESTVFTRKYCTEITNLSMLSVFEVEIWCYRGGNTVPKWINRHDDAFSTLCVVQADLSLLNNSAEPKAGRNGKKYWTIVFSVEIHFGLTEFKARMKWMDNGQVRYGPAVIVYNERGHRIDDDDIDLYPEDDQSFQSSRLDRDRSRRDQPPYAQSPTGSSSRRVSTTTATPEAPQVERTSSKTYSPSLAPSSRSAAYQDAKGSDGDRTGSDSDRRRGKERERGSRYEEGYRERGHGGASGTATPVERSRSSAAYGASSMSRVASSTSATGGPVGVGDMLSSSWAPPTGAPSSRSPSIRPPQSRSTSVYAGERPAAIATPNNASQPPPHSRSPSIYAGGAEVSPATPAAAQDWNFGGAPKPAVDEQRNSHLWDNPSGSQPSSFDANADRPRSTFVSDEHVSAPAQDPIFGQPPSMFDQQQESSFNRPKSPFVTEPARAPSPFADHNKSGAEGGLFSNDRPKSAFGEHPPAMFGDTGPAADAGGAANTPLFGEPPASVFGTDAPGGATDGWGFSATTSPPAPAVPEPASAATTPGKKGKKKSGATTPASGLASRASPAVSAKKSPLGASPAITGGGIFDEPAATTAAPATTPSLWGTGTGGLWGAKGTSPKPLSPLNPASQVTNEPIASSDAAPATDTWDTWGTSNNASGGDSWGGGNNENTSGGGDGWGNGNNDNAAGGVDSWGQVNLDDAQPKAPSPAAPAAPPVEETATPVEELPTPTAVKKKKKKSTAAEKKAEEDAAKKKAEEDGAKKKAEEDAAVKKAEEEAAAAVKKAEEEATAAKKKADEEAAQKVKEEEDRKARETAKQKEKEEKERKEKEEREKEEREKEEREKAAAAPASLFGNTTSAFGDTGGGDDSWGGWGFGSGTKKKKGSKATTPITPAAPSVFGGSSWGFGGPTSAFESAPNVAPSPKPELGAFDFSSSGPSLGFSFGATENKSASKPPSRAPSPQPVAVTTEEPAAPAETTGDTPAEGAPEGGEAGDKAGETNADEDEGAGDTTGKKKKKKKKAAEADATTATPANEEPPPSAVEPPPAAEAEAEPAAAESAPMTTVSSKKKKKKK